MRFPRREVEVSATAFGVQSALDRDGFEQRRLPRSVLADEECDLLVKRELIDTLDRGQTVWELLGIGNPIPDQFRVKQVRPGSGRLSSGHRDDPLHGRVLPINPRSSEFLIAGRLERAAGVAGRPAEDLVRFARTRLRSSHRSADPEFAGMTSRRSLSQSRVAVPVWRLRSAIDVKTTPAAPRSGGQNVDWRRERTQSRKFSHRASVSFLGGSTATNVAWRGRLLQPRREGRAAGRVVAMKLEPALHELDRAEAARGSLLPSGSRRDGRGRATSWQPSS